MARKSFTVGGEEIHIDINSHNAKGKGKNVMAGKKRKVSKKVLANLKQGRKKLAAMRKKKSLHGASRKVRAVRPLSKEGAIVATRKRTRRKSRVHGVAGFGGKSRKRSRRFHGFEGRSRRRRSRGRLMGGLNVKGIKQQVMPIALGIAGAGVAAFALSKLPKTINPMIKAAIPLVAGIGASVVIRNPMIGAVGLGAAIIGGYALARQALPTVVPALSGVEDTVNASMMPLGSLEDLSGYDGEVRQLGNATDISGDLDGDMEGDLDGDMEGDLDGDMEGDLDGELDGELEGVDAL